jgi:hypothetical protein
LGLGDRILCGQGGGVGVKAQHGITPDSVGSVSSVFVARPYLYKTTSLPSLLNSLRKYFQIIFLAAAAWPK